MVLSCRVSADSTTLAITEHMVTEFTSNSTAYDMLVGRAIICQGVFTMDFSGRFSFSV